MVQMKTCCCCLDLRQGTLLSLGYTLATSILSLIGTGITLAKLLGRDQKDEDQLIVSGVTFLLYLLWLISTIVAYIGLSKDKRGMFIPWIVMTIIMTLLAIYLLIFVFMDLKEQTSTFGGIVRLIMAIVAVVCNGYALVCVCFFFKNRLRTV